MGVHTNIYMYVWIVDIGRKGNSCSFNQNVCFIPGRGARHLSAFGSVYSAELLLFGEPQRGIVFVLRNLLSKYNGN